MKTIVILGTLDTKGQQIEFISNEIRKRGCDVLIMDMSTGAESSFAADITSGEIARAAKASIEVIRASKDRNMIRELIINGAIKKAQQLLSSGKLDGLLALGGYSAAAICTKVMKSLPFGIPKLMITSAAGMPDTGTWIGTSDIIMFNAVVDLVGINEMVKNVLSRAAHAICGMVDMPTGNLKDMLSTREPLVAVTEWGASEKCGKYICAHLEKKGYKHIVFHAQGVGDRAMEELIAQGFFEGVVDVVTGGIIDELIEGRRAAGPERLESAGKRGIPQVIAPSGLNITGAGPTRKKREKYISREKVLKLDELRIFVRLNEDELILGAQTVADKLNKSKGLVQFFAPLRGWSSWDSEDGVLYDPKLDRIFIEELKKKLRANIKVAEIDVNLEDASFAEAMVDAFDMMMKKKSKL
jgi:uncharacterized protein (UPF0261 family)